MTTTPILKWAGSKRYLAPRLLERIPRRYGRYYEPFFGGGALFFALHPGRAVLGDINVDLMRTYRTVVDDVESVVCELREHARLHSRDHYYRTRERWNADPASRRASTFIYFNKTGFNGLWRMNRSGAMNVPMGRYANPTICDADALRAASRVLRSAELRDGDYRQTIAEAERGDLVYIDSPHHQRSKTSSFTAYTANAFSEDDQAELAEVARRLAARRVRVLLSNADTPFVRKLYRGWAIAAVTCPRLINSIADRRGSVNELIISA